MTPSGAAATVRRLDDLEPDLGRLFIVVGVFDGLHRGHAYLIRHLRREAQAHGARATVLTFDAHPAAVLQGHAPPLLLDPDERIGRLAEAGVEVVVVAHFDEALRRTPYDAFLRSIAGRVDLAGLLMTPEAAFGHERRGTPPAVAALGREIGFDLVVVPTHTVVGTPVSSTTIRAAIGAGDLAEARRLLGRDVALAGRFEGRRLVSELPLATPPAGRYRAVLEPAWTAAGRPSEGWRRPAEVVIDGDAVGLVTDPPAPAAGGHVRLRLPAS